MTVPCSCVLLGGEREVDGHPADQSRARLAEELEVEVADARIERGAHPEVVDGVAGDALVLGAGLLAPPVEVEAEAVGEDVDRGQQRRRTCRRALSA